MKVAYIANRYPEQRLIIDRVRGIDYVFINMKKSINFITKRIYEKIKKINYAWDASSIFNPILKLPKDVDLIHSFNTVCATKKKWVITYESFLPRTRMTTYQESLWMRKKIAIDTLTRYEIELLSKENCVAIIAISQSAKKIESHFINIYAQELSEKILSKITVVLPPQKLYTNAETIEKKYKNIERRKIKFLFVGRHFFLKGCDILIDVLESLYNNYQFELSIVSSMEYAYWLDFSNKSNVEKYKSRINQYEWIKWYPKLPNENVMELCKECDVGIFPSFNDTFGYSVLEMQACGCPVVSTNIRALKEINNDKCGWICEFPLLDELDIAIMDDKNSIEANRNALKEQLYYKIKNILDNPQQIKNKAISSYERIKEYHDPQKYSEDLNKIYMNL